MANFLSGSDILEVFLHFSHAWTRVGTYASCSCHPGILSITILYITADVIYVLFTTMYVLPGQGQYRFCSPLDSRGLVQCLSHRRCVKYLENVKQSKMSKIVVLFFFFFGSDLSCKKMKKKKKNERSC